MTVIARPVSVHSTHTTHTHTHTHTHTLKGPLIKKRAVAFTQKHPKNTFLPANPARVDQTSEPTFKHAHFCVKQS